MVMSSMSTSHALIDLVEEISESMDKKLYTLGVFIDLKKAFDTVKPFHVTTKVKFLWYSWCSREMD